MWRDDIISIVSNSFNLSSYNTFLRFFNETWYISLNFMILQGEFGAWMSINLPHFDHF